MPKMKMPKLPQPGGGAGLAVARVTEALVAAAAGSAPKGGDDKTKAPTDEFMGCTTKQPLDWEFRYQPQPLPPPLQPGPIYGMNERIANWYFPKLNTTFTCDWKMHAFRKYDRWLLQRRFAKEAPDLFVVSAGLHDCVWRRVRSGADHEMEIRALFDHLHAHLPERTQLVYLSSQRQPAPQDPGDHTDCIDKVNSAAREEAKARDFAFVDKERLTRSLVEQQNGCCHADDTDFHNFVPRIIHHYLMKAAKCLMIDKE